LPRASVRESPHLFSRYLQRDAHIRYDAAPSIATFPTQGSSPTDTSDSDREIIDEARKLVGGARHPSGGPDAHHPSPTASGRGRPHQWHNFRLGRVCERCGVIQANDELAETACEPRVSQVVEGCGLMRRRRARHRAG
jgi:hypothetical protein